MIATVSLTEGDDLTKAPWRFEAGTPNGGIYRLGARAGLCQRAGLTHWRI